MFIGHFPSTVFDIKTLNIFQQNFVAVQSYFNLPLIALEEKLYFSYFLRFLSSLKVYFGNKTNCVETYNNIQCFLKHEKHFF